MNDRQRFLSITNISFFSFVLEFKSTTKTRRDEAASRPKGEFVPKTLTDLNIDAVLPIGGNGSTDGLSNGGRLLSTRNTTNHSNRTKSNNQNMNNNNNNNSSNCNNHNVLVLYSSQQNLSKTNIIHNSNFARSRIYGSQQSLSTISNRSSNNSINTKQLLSQYQQHQQHSTTSNSYNLLGFNSSNSHLTNGVNIHVNNNINNNNHTSPTDVWLNAWNSPSPSSNLISTNTTASYNHNTTSAAQSTVSHFATTTTSGYQATNTSNHNHQSSTSNSHLNNYDFNDPWTGDFYFVYFSFNLQFIFTF